MADFIPNPLVISDKQFCQVLKFLSLNTDSKLCKKLLPVLNEFRNECLQDIEQLARLAQLLQALHDLDARPEKKLFQRSNNNLSKSARI
jgi:hypothetical protein